MRGRRAWADAGGRAWRATRRRVARWHAGRRAESSLERVLLRDHQWSDSHALRQSVRSIFLSCPPLPSSSLSVSCELPPWATRLPCSLGRTCGGAGCAGLQAASWSPYRDFRAGLSICTWSADVQSLSYLATAFVRPVGIGGRGLRLGTRLSPTAGGKGYVVARISSRNCVFVISILCLFSSRKEFFASPTE